MLKRFMHSWVSIAQRWTRTCYSCCSTSSSALALILSCCAHISPLFSLYFPILCSHILLFSCATFTINAMWYNFGNTKNQRVYAFHKAERFFFCVHKIFNIENVAPTTHELDISRIQIGGARVKTHSNMYIYICAWRLHSNTFWCMPIMRAGVMIAKATATPVNRTFARIIHNFR